MRNLEIWKIFLNSGAYDYCIQLICIGNMVSGIEETEAQTEKDFKYNIKRFFLFHILAEILFSVGALVYFYLEECAYPVERTMSETEYRLDLVCRNMTAYNQSSELCIQFYHEMSDEIPKCELDVKASFQWILFCAILGHTVGFGNIVPKSDPGKIFTIFYGFMIITVVATHYIYLTRCINTLIEKIIKYVMKLCKVRQHSRNIDKEVLFVNILLVITAWLVLADIYTDEDYENLRFIDSVYFVFVTMTTVGFGDYSIDERRFSKDGISYGFLLLPYLMLTWGFCGSLLSTASTCVSKMRMPKRSCCHAPME